MEKLNKRFIANETFTDDDNTEYAQGAIYEVDETTEPLLQRWIAEGKVRDADAIPSDEVEQTIEELKAKHEADDNGEDEDDDDDDAA
jgi:hypothetical protein